MCLAKRPRRGAIRFLTSVSLSQNHPIPNVDLPGLSARLQMRSTGTPRFSLGCEITEQGDALEVAWLSRLSMISQEETEHLDRVFEADHALRRRRARSPEKSNRHFHDPPAMSSPSATRARQQSVPVEIARAPLGESLGVSSHRDPFRAYSETALIAALLRG